MKLKNIVSGMVVGLALTGTASAELLSDNGVELYLNSGVQYPKLQSSGFFSLAAAPENIQLDYDYRATFQSARIKVKNLLLELNQHRQESLNDQVAYLANQLADIPYAYKGAMGEGDWQPKSLVYLGGKLHLQQDPVYRFDALDCATFVQNVIALLHSNTLDEFDQTILKIAYGAAHNPEGEIVHYYNRNHFVNKDFNPVNRANGFLTDETTDNLGITKTMEDPVTRLEWFKTKTPNDTLRLISAANVQSMSERLANYSLSYQEFYARVGPISPATYAEFQKKVDSITYFPKENLLNSGLLDKIPTPAVIEIVINPAIRHSPTNISHLGLLYRQTFKQNQKIYDKIQCRLESGTKICSVEPVLCQQAQCNELMFVESTVAYPNGYYWYQQNNQQVCSADQPTESSGTLKQCNRVEKIPLIEYLKRAAPVPPYASFMESPSIVGIHIEQLH